MPGMNDNNARVIQYQRFKYQQQVLVSSTRVVWRAILLAKLATKLLQQVFIICSLLYHFICFTKALFCCSSGKGKALLTTSYQSKKATLALAQSTC